MRNFILVALTFHLLVITVVEINGDYTFGDIISFPRKCAKINKVYKHFAVYVGTKNLFGQGKDKDIFHRTHKPIDGKYCVFISLKNEGEHEKDNYLDNKFTPSSRDDMIEKIKLMNNETQCGKYNLIDNNCEHLATDVRYGKVSLKQPGTIAGKFLERFKVPELKNISEVLKSIAAEENIDIEDLCNNAVMPKSVLRTPTLLTCLAFLCSFFYMT